MAKRISKKNKEKLMAIINSYGLTKQDLTNREKMDEMNIRLRADLARIGLSLEQFYSLPDYLKKKNRSYHGNSGADTNI